MEVATASEQNIIRNGGGLAVVAFDLENESLVTGFALRHGCGGRAMGRVKAVPEGDVRP